MFKFIKNIFSKKYTISSHDIKSCKLYIRYYIRPSYPCIVVDDYIKKLYDKKLLRFEIRSCHHSGWFPEKYRVYKFSDVLPFSEYEILINNTIFFTTGFYYVDLICYDKKILSNLKIRYYK